MNKFALLFLIGYFAFGQDKTEILIVGSDHLSNIYKQGNSNTDVLSPENQKSISDFNNMVAKFKPDAILIEELPEKQMEIDSLYRAYLLDPKTYDRSEVVQIAFAVGKKLGIRKINCVNAPGGTSQSLLDNGDNIEIYKNETAELRKIVGAKYSEIAQGKLSFRDFLIFVNQPETYNKIYHLRYVTPSRVMNGTFKNPERAIDTSKIDKQYIGAELTSIWKNRDYKIYSNIVSVLLRERPKRILVLIGVAHVGSLKGILRDDPEFNLVEAARFLR